MNTVTSSYTGIKARPLKEGTRMQQGSSNRSRVSLRFRSNPQTSLPYSLAQPYSQPARPCLSSPRGVCSGELEQACTLPGNNTTSSYPCSLARKSSSYHNYTEEKHSQRHASSCKNIAQNRNYITHFMPLNFFAVTT